MNRQERKLIESEIIAEALDLAVEESKYAYCPFCVAKHEAKLSITRTQEGLLYNCYRGACGARGFISSIPGTTQLELSRPRKAFQPKEFTYNLEELPGWVVSTINKRYEITEEELNEQGFRWIPEQDRIYMPLFDRNGQEYGANTKVYGPRASGPKTIIYRTEETSGLHYIRRRGNEKSSTICISEDTLSALKISRYVRAVALLGANLREEQIAELREETDHLILMLDPDMYQKMLSYRKKYSFYFNRFDVVLLNRDPKDEKHIKLRELFSDLDVL